MHRFAAHEGMAQLSLSDGWVAQRGWQGGEHLEFSAPPQGVRLGWVHPGERSVGGHGRRQRKSAGGPVHPGWPGQCPLGALPGQQHPVLGGLGVDQGGWGAASLGEDPGDLRGQQHRDGQGHGVGVQGQPHLVAP